MKAAYRFLLTIIVVSGISFNASAQQIVWFANNDLPANITKDKAVARQSYPKEFRLFDLNIDPLRQQLFSIVGAGAPGRSTVISLPGADGNIEQFEVFEASNFEPDLQSQFPEIRAFSGKGITDVYATLKLSISPQGIQTMVFRTDRENEFIEPYSEDHTVYAVFKSQRVKGELPWTCSTEDKRAAADINSQLPPPGPLSNTGQLKTMRLAQSCNAEYSNYFGATSSAQVSLVLAAFNATLTRANGVYEKDLALHLNLIANTSLVIYYNPSTDPYTSMANWNSQLQTTLTNNIGAANYDIGHMFGASGGGGNAGCIGCVCVDATKGRGITSPADGIPMGDNFDIDYVVHEVGHQLGANHSFSFDLEGTGVNKEVGAGITIMGYAGITDQDPAPHSIDIFHQASIAQIQTNLAGKTCPVTVNMTANHPPVVAAVSNRTIPISTPFALTGSATDPEGDVLTYCWEQNDNSTTSGNASVASAAKTTGPNWLSFSPSSSPTRSFPKLSTIQAGLLITPVLPGGDAICNIEALSSVSRTLNFRLTVRDNNLYSAGVKVGQTQFTDMTVTVSNTSGPFQVTSPNTAVSWGGNSSQTVTWNVNGTTGAPVSCANVNILLSTDGGTTFPTVLVAGTPNDGTQSVTIPNTATTTARMKVESVGNIFFDFSNANFTITASTLSAPSLVFPSDNATQQPVSLTIRWNTVATATSYRLQVGTDSTFAGGMIVNDSTLTDTLRVVSGMNTNTKYFWRVNAKNGSGTSSYSVLRRFTTITPPAAVILVSPSDNATQQSVSLTLKWNTTATATSYRLQVGTDSTFVGGMVVNDSTIVDTSAVASGLNMNTKYFWRVNAKNTVGYGAASSLRRFTTISPPAAVILVSPSDNAIQQPVSLTLKWNTTSTATSYRLQVGTDSTFAAGMVVNDSTLTDTSHLVSGLSMNTKYFWRVNAKNAAGYGVASSLRRFTTTAPPAVVTLVSPSDNATGQPVSLTLRWNTVSATTFYRLEVSTDSTFAGGVVVDDSALTDTSRVVSGLNTNTKYFWRATARNAAGSGPTSSMRRFTTVAPPAAVALVSPADNATGQLLSLTLRWHPVSVATAYALQLSTDSTFTGGLVVNDSTLTDTSRVASGLAGGTQYFWRARGSNTAGDGAWSPVWKFTTTFPPAAVVLMTPADDAVIPVDSVVLVWGGAGPGVTTYWLERSTDSTFAGALIDSTITDTIFVAQSLTDSTSYWWKVKAKNVAGWGAFSAAREFKTAFQITVCFSVQPSWNLVSLPVSVTDDSSAHLFPQCVPGCPFRFDGGSGYEQECRMENGLGYWIKCVSGSPCITGSPVMLDSVPVVAGWNLIGTISVPLNVSGIETVPQNIIESDFYSFDNGYNKVSVLQPAAGYWVKINQAGVIVLDGTGSRPPAARTVLGSR